MAAKFARTILISAAALGLLTACSSQPSIAGMWAPSDGTATKVISENGSCSGMYYNGTTPLDIGSGMTCTLSDSESGGYYQMVVSQPPNQITYQVKFSGDSMTLVSGGQEIVTLTRQ